MRSFFAIVTILTLISSGLTWAQVPKSTQGNAQEKKTDAETQKCKTKTVISGGNDMGTYIDAVQQNFGDPCVVVTEPSIKADKK